MKTIDQFFIAIFDEKPEIGSVNPPGEVAVDGYKRLPCVFVDGKSVSEIVFEPFGHDFTAKFYAVLDGSGKVVHVETI